MILKKIEKEEAEVEEERDEVMCLRCGYTWKPFVVLPKRCAQCGSYSWNKERVRNIKEERRAKYRPRPSQFSPTHPPKKGDEQ